MPGSAKITSLDLLLTISIERAKSQLETARPDRSHDEVEIVDNEERLIRLSRQRAEVQAIVRATQLHTVVVYSAVAIRALLFASVAASIGYAILTHDHGGFMAMAAAATLLAVMGRNAAGVAPTLADAQPNSVCRERGRGTE